MSFTDSLMSNPSASIYGQPGQQQGQDVLGVVNQLKDREMRDFQNKANFMSDLSLKQDRIKALFNPEDPNNISGARSASGVQGGEPGMKQNVVMGQDPGAVSGFQKGELDLRKSQQGLESQKMAQAGKMGEERIGIQRDQEKLNQQKSDQIHQQKLAEHERKINESNAKLTQAQAALEAKTAAGENALAEHKAVREAMEERHGAETARDQAKLDQRDREFAALQKQHDEVIKQHANTKTTTSVNPEGTEKTTTTQRGSAADTVQVTHKNGKTYEIPKDKLDHWNANHAPEAQQEDDK